MDRNIERISGEIVDISAPRIHAETSIAMLQRKFGQAADPAGRSLVGAVRRRQENVAGAFAAGLRRVDPRDLT